MDQLTQLRERLLAQAYLFDEPATYAAGVDDALAALAAEMGTPAPGGSVTIDLRDGYEPSIDLAT